MTDELITFFDEMDPFEYRKNRYNFNFKETDEDKLDNIDMSVIETYVRKKKLENINNK